MNAVAKLRQHFDWTLAGVCLALLVLGLINLRSATASTELRLVRQQSLWILIGLSVAFVSALVDYRAINRAAYSLYGCGIVMLVLVLLVGKSVNQSQRWLSIAGLAWQPSELMKVLLIIGLAKYLHEHPVVEGRSLKHIAIPLLLVAVPVFLVLRQPDLGTAMIIFLVFLSVMLLTRLKLRSIAGLMFVAAISLPLTYTYVLRDYQRERIHTFLNPSDDPSGAGWQARQSVFAIGSGRLTGKGYMRGTQNRFHFLPERWTDFPFAVWGEEWGFVGAAALLGLYLFLILWAVKLATQARDRFGAVLCVGVAAMVFWHTVFSIGMVTGLVPVVGVTLPLFSYGGSSMVTMLCAAGLLMNVSVRKTAF